MPGILIKQSHRYALFEKIVINNPRHYRNRLFAVLPQGKKILNTGSPNLRLLIHTEFHFSLKGNQFDGPLQVKWQGLIIAVDAVDFRTSITVWPYCVRQKFAGTYTAIALEAPEGDLQGQQ